MTIADSLSVESGGDIPESLKGFGTRRVTQMMAINDLLVAIAETCEYWC